jgi:hypothetical protein
MLSAKPDQRLIVDFLEAPGAEQPEVDTGGVGIDVIPHDYTRETSNKAQAYMPLVDLLKSYFQIGLDDDERRRREKITGKLLTLDRALENTLHTCSRFSVWPGRSRRCGTWNRRSAASARRKRSSACCCVSRWINPC